MAQSQDLAWFENEASTDASHYLYPYYPTDAQDHMSGIEFDDIAKAGEVNPQEYAQKVRDHSQTSISNSLYSGQRYVSLAQFLWAPYQFVPGRPSLSRSKPGQGGDFATLCEFNNEIPLVPTPMRRSSSQLQTGNTSSYSCLLFLRGYPSATWLNELGARYKIDPEFFYRHLYFLSNDQHNNRPDPFVLPSSQSTIFQLTMTSIGVQESRRHTGINSVRIDGTKKMETYLHNLKIGQGWRCRNSVVRSFNTHSENEFSIEQAITVYVASTDKESGRWLVIVWLDCGDDLCKSPSGPWLDSPDSQFHTYFRPIALYKPNIALKDHRTTANHDRCQSSGPPHTELPQSASLLPELYGRSLNPRALSSDPFYALTELFDFFCASELEFLNMISTKLNDMGSGSSYLEADSMAQMQADLTHHRKALEDHVHKIFETWTFVKNRSSLKWPRSNTSKAVNAAARIEHDLEYLRDRSRLMQQRCERELTTMNNNANIAEARRGIDQGKRGFKITVLAFLYVPFSFSCSIFGMNFVQFSDFRHGYWVWAGVTLPILATSVLYITWDLIARDRTWLRRWL